MLEIPDVVKDGHLVETPAIQRSIRPLEYQTLLYVWSSGYVIFNDPILTFDNEVMSPDVHISTQGPYHVTQESPTQFIIKYNCIASGETELEVLIPME